MESAERPFTVVVGVDGSDDSLAALEWGLAEARLHGGEILAVTAWEYPAMVAGGMGPADPGTYEDSARSAQDMVLARADTAGTPVRREIVRGNPAKALLEASEGADLLVVGSRGHGGFAGLLLGSVSAQVVHHSPCTTVVVRPLPHRRR
jgi:nucleotide-binding universal stress UspA family protein